MHFKKIKSLEDEGFEGFSTVASLMQHKCRCVPAKPGVYMVIKPKRKLKSNELFRDETVGTDLGNRDRKITQDYLQQRWISDTVVLYIGKAGNCAGGAPLRSRLQQYMRFGCSKTQSKNHSGGRLIWWLKNYADLLVCYKASPTDHPMKKDCPIKEEKRLLNEFKSRYNDKLPFANLRN